MNLVIFGYGYSSRAFARLMRSSDVRIVGTVRSATRAAALSGDGVTVCAFDGTMGDPRLADAIASAHAVLISIPPDSEGDPVLQHFSDALAAAPSLRWVGYLSTIGVYGDQAGGWVDETSATRSVSERSVRRIAAERGWLDFGQRSGKAVQIFRLGGIYGPGQNALLNVADGTARRIIKPGQVFNRIHVEDIAGALAASLARPESGAIYNVTDDEPAPPQDVIAYAAELIGVPVPPELPFATADLSPMARSFYSENRRVSNAKLRKDLGYALRYPTYREALKAMADAGEGRRS